MKRFTIFLGLAALFLTPVVLADVPQLINFQGILRNGSGGPIANQTKPVIFTIYTAALNGTVLWAESTSVTTDAEGLFNVILGAHNPVPDTVFSDTITFLGIKVDTDPEMTPRQRLVSVSYSFGFSGWVISDSNLILADRLGGSVGIGTADPSEKLEVDGNIKGDTLFGDAFSSTSPLRLQTNRITRIYVSDVSGNVGIGVDTPLVRLHVGLVGVEGTPTFIPGTMIAAQSTNAGNWTHMAIISSSSGQARLNFGDASNDDQGMVAYNNSTDAMFFATAAAERMRITSAGNVGIGTASPNSRVHINGPAATAITTTSNNLTLDNSHSVVLCNTTLTINLPTAAGIAGRQYTIKKVDNIDPFTVTIDPAGAEMIDAAATKVLSTSLAFAVIVSDGANWWVVGQ